MGANATKADADAKVSAAQKGKRKSPETRERMRAAQQLRALQTVPYHSEAARAKMSAAQAGIPKSAEHRAKISAAQKGRVVPPDVLAKRSAALKGQKRTAETRANSSASQMGHTVSDEARRKIGDANRGRTHSAETRAKMSAGPDRKKMERGNPPRQDAHGLRTAARSVALGLGMASLISAPADPAILTYDLIWLAIHEASHAVAHLCLRPEQRCPQRPPVQRKPWLRPPGAAARPQSARRGGLLHGRLCRRS